MSDCDTQTVVMLSFPSFLIETVVRREGERVEAVRQSTIRKRATRQQEITLARAINTPLLLMATGSTVARAVPDAEAAATVPCYRIENRHYIMVTGDRGSRQRRQRMRRAEDDESECADQHSKR